MLYIFLIGFSIIPNLLMYLHLSNTPALGIAIISIFFILANLKLISFKRLGSEFIIPLIIILFMTVQLLLVGTFHEIDYLKGYLSIPLISLLIFCSYLICKIFLNINEFRVNKIINIVYFILIFIALLYVLGVKIESDTFQKGIFPFTEPSIWALTIAPFYIYKVSTSSKIYSSLINITVMTFFALYIENMTTLLLVVLSIYLISKKIGSYFFFLLILAAGIVIYQMEYFSNRIAIGGNNESLLAFLNGWESSLYIFENGKYLGLGFQQLGTEPIETASMNRMIELVGHTSNTTDGGFLVAKILCEFGVIGLFIMAIYIKSLKNSLSFLRLAGADNDKTSSKTIFFNACIASSIPYMLFKGNGYFSISIILLFASAFYFYKKNSR